jgi:predicted O-methyltransferase YrrM
MAMLAALLSPAIRQSRHRRGEGGLRLANAVGIAAPASRSRGIRVPKQLRLPAEQQLVALLRSLGDREEAIALSTAALQSGEFRHPDGRVDHLGDVRVTLQQAGLLAHLAASCPTPLSIEVGFGMGSSAAIILGTRRLQGKPFSHFIFDPYGLPDGSGQIVQSYLQARFPKAFRRVMKPSEIGLAALLDNHGPGTAGLVFIDGGHRFENVMIDFVLADQLCSVGGFVVLDDAWFPAIETVVNYVRANRPDYAVAHLPVPNCSVLRKIGSDERTWDAFTPFQVPQRSNWTPPPGVDAPREPVRQPA